MAANTSNIGLSGDEINKRGHKKWRLEDEHILLQRRAERIPYARIADELGRSEMSCRIHVHQMSTSGRGSSVRYDVRPPQPSRRPRVPPSRRSGLPIPALTPRRTHPIPGPASISAPCPKILVCCCRRHLMSVPEPPCHKGLPVGLPSFLVRQQQESEDRSARWESFYERQFGPRILEPPFEIDISSAESTIAESEMSTLSGAEARESSGQGRYERASGDRQGDRRENRDRMEGSCSCPLSAILNPAFDLSSS